VRVAQDSLDAGESRLRVWLTARDCRAPRCLRGPLVQREKGLAQGRVSASAKLLGGRLEVLSHAEVESAARALPDGLGEGG